MRNSRPPCLSSVPWGATVPAGFVLVPPPLGVGETASRASPGVGGNHICILETRRASAVDMEFRGHLRGAGIHPEARAEHP